MRILILEDEPVISERLRRICAGYFAAQRPVLHCVDQLADAIDVLAGHPVDLVLLDLNLHGASGFDLLRRSGGTFHTIIVSAYADQALRAFEFRVLDFVAKPFRQERLEQALALVFGARERSGAVDSLAVKCLTGLQVLPLREVAYIRAAGHYCELILKDGQVRLHDRSIDTMALLLPQRFVRIHRSFLVPLHQIAELTGEAGGRYGVRLHCGATLAVGRTRYAELKALLLDPRSGVVDA